MGENKGHGVKGPRHDNDIDDPSASQGSQKQSGNMQSGQQPGNMQSGKQQSGQQKQGSQQSGKQGSQQSGGQHASGGTPALDDPGASKGESAKDAAQAWNQDSADKPRGNR
ncbi:hypothetical protein [Massilia yuzhufengensis]|uniref:Ca-activated chloride channel family protein n=1 Tax=Massilia yuzhufengensis TaxID=1164594 RepID=A0A1I1WVF9_9BURK|nr:hypothetical protein [Massilia yuzhufengensis]SFD99175.1 Ca-activated chloride channel family protein [Massilia yuzhufengensis]